MSCHEVACQWELLRAIRGGSCQLVNMTGARAFLATKPFMFESVALLGLFLG
jgi:hypothetical protein